MIIHVVEQGETASSIARKYDVSVERLIRENEINSPDNLVIGETLVVLFPSETYTIQEGDTLQGIADMFDVSVMQLLRNNPYLSDRENIYPGETIVIRYEDNKIRQITTNGYAYPFINRDILKKTLPFLTYLSIFSYAANEEGELQDIDDEEIIEIAKQYNVAPIMMITPSGERDVDEINVIHSILGHEETQDCFIENILSILRKKGFYGVNLTTKYILPSDRELYVAFLIKFSSRVKSEGFKVFNTFLLNTFEIITYTTYREIDYEKISEAIDGFMIISYELGYSIGFPINTIAYDVLINFFASIVTQVPSEKLILGVPIIGYIWSLPYEAGYTRGRAITYNSAVDLAREEGVNIDFDNITKAAYFRYTSTNEFVVRFPDARSVDAYLNLLLEFNLNGVVIWNIMFFFPQLWLIINSQYEIEKLII